MTFTLHVPGSGDPGDPQEFEISPESGTLPPNFHQVIQVSAGCCCLTLCSHNFVICCFVDAIVRSSPVSTSNLSVYPKVLSSNLVGRFFSLG